MKRGFARGTASDRVLRRLAEAEATLRAGKPTGPDGGGRHLGDLARLLAAVRRALSASEARHRTLSRRILEVQERERRALARELHDELGQTLTSIQLGLEAARSGPAVAGALDESIRGIGAAIEQVRDLARHLRPPALEELGLVPALRSQLELLSGRAGFEARLEARPPEARLPAALETTCFRLVQEALTNVARHAGARRVQVDLRVAGGAVEIAVRDDGRGFDVRAARLRGAAGVTLGLVGMEERVALAGGRLEVDSAPGRGTIVRAHLPLSSGGGS